MVYRRVHVLDDMLNLVLRSSLSVTDKFHTQTKQQEKIIVL